MKVGDLVRVADVYSVTPSWRGQLCIVAELTETRACIKRLHDGYVGSINPGNPHIEMAGGEYESR